MENLAVRKRVSRSKSDEVTGVNGGGRTRGARGGEGRKKESEKTWVTAEKSFSNDSSLW